MRQSDGLAFLLMPQSLNNKRNSHRRAIGATKLLHYGKVFEKGPSVISGESIAIALPISFYKFRKMHSKNSIIFYTVHYITNVM